MVTKLTTERDVYKQQSEDLQQQLLALQSDYNNHNNHNNHSHSGGNPTAFPSAASAASSAASSASVGSLQAVGDALLRERLKRGEEKINELHAKVLVRKL